MKKSELVKRQLQKVTNVYEVVIATRKAMDIMIIKFNLENEGRGLSESDNLGMIINAIDTHYNTVFEYALLVNALKYHYELMDTTKL